MDLNKIKELIKLVEEADISGIAIEDGDLKIEVKKTPEGVMMAPAFPAAPVTGSAPAAPAKAEAKDPHAGLQSIKSPMTGTFYWASSPDSPPYIKVGDRVSAGKTVCIVEAMKTFNEIESELAGTIEKCLVNNGTPVEMGQPLFLVR